MLFYTLQSKSTSKVPFPCCMSPSALSDLCLVPRLFPARAVQSRCFGCPSRASHQLELVRSRCPTRAGLSTRVLQLVRGATGTATASRKAPIGNLHEAHQRARAPRSIQHSFPRLYKRQVGHPTDEPRRRDKRPCFLRDGAPTIKAQRPSRLQVPMASMAAQHLSTSATSCAGRFWGHHHT